MSGILHRSDSVIGLCVAATFGNPLFNERVKVALDRNITFHSWLILAIVFCTTHSPKGLMRVGKDNKVWQKPGQSLQQGVLRYLVQGRPLADTAPQNLKLQNHTKHTKVCCKCMEVSNQVEHGCQLDKTHGFA
eukprot:4428287-Amphidinium_carterae.1